MKITLDNYQDFAADWLDGTLPEELLSAFESFMTENPNIRQELEEIRYFNDIAPDNDDHKADFSALKRDINEKTVNADNFLEFVMARMDGELDADSKVALQAFLDDSPALDREAKLFELTELAPDEDIRFPGKDLLIQNVGLRGERVHENNLDELIIASLEGELVAEDQAELDNYLAENEKAMLLYKQYSMTLLKPDLSVAFPGKENLKQKAVVSLFTRRKVLQYFAVAASIVFLMGIFLFDRGGDMLLTIPGDDFLATTIVPERPLPVKPSEIVIAQTVSERTERAFVSETNRRSITTETIIADPVVRDETPVFAGDRHYSRNVNAIASATPLSVLTSPIRNYGAVPIPDDVPSRGRLTIEEFPIEQIRYFTGGGNERPGLLADISLSRIITVANPHERINQAGQQIFSRWTQLKERTLDEVIPYR